MTALSLPLAGEPEVPLYTGDIEADIRTMNKKRAEEIGGKPSGSSAEQSCPRADPGGGCCWAPAHVWPPRPFASSAGPIVASKGDRSSWGKRSKLVGMPTAQTCHSLPARHIAPAADLTP